MNTRIEILGERKTGTNYVKQMLLKHFDGFDLVNHGWKHRLIEVSKLPDDTIYIICTKNPYSWIQSLYDKPYHMLDSKKDGFSGFLRNKANDLNGKPVYNNPVRMWNQKHYRYMNLLKSDKMTYLIRHESVLENFRLVFMRFHKEHGIKIVKRLSNIRNHVGDLGVMRYLHNPNKYGAIKNADRQFINQQLNNNIVKYFNYQ